MKVVLIGTGNLAHHLGDLFVKNGIEIVQVIGRSPVSTKKLAKRIGCAAATDYSKIDLSADVYLLLVADHDIPMAIKGLPLEKKVIAHASGTASIKVFPSRFAHAGVFWPLQTFTKDRILSNELFPICLESRSSRAKSHLNRLAKSMGCPSFTLRGKDRELLHLGAVLVNNLPNHLFTLTESLLNKHKIPFELLHPLIAETAVKIKSGSPRSMQTGPARRGDSSTIDRHLQLLKSDRRLHKIYKLLSESIEETHGPIL